MKSPHPRLGPGHVPGFKHAIIPHARRENMPPPSSEPLLAGLVSECMVGGTPTRKSSPLKGDAAVRGRPGATCAPQTSPGHDERAEHIRLGPKGSMPVSGLGATRPRVISCRQSLQPVTTRTVSSPLGPLGKPSSAHRFWKTGKLPGESNRGMSQSHQRNVRLESSRRGRSLQQ